VYHPADDWRFIDVYNTTIERDFGAVFGMYQYWPKKWTFFDDHVELDSGLGDHNWHPVGRCCATRVAILGMFINFILGLKAEINLYNNSAVTKRSRQLVLDPPDELAHLIYENVRAHGLMFGTEPWSSKPSTVSLMDKHITKLCLLDHAEVLKPYSIVASNNPVVQARDADDLSDDEMIYL
jgi:hypothetical protein